MLTRISPHLRSILQALFVTFLWSTSWVLIKIGLQELPALTFAGLRYFLAFLALLPTFFYSRGIKSLWVLSWRELGSLTALGLLYYTITQGSQFLGLVYLPAITFSLLLNSTAIVVALLGIPLLNERPLWSQWVGILIFLLGAMVFFYPLSIPKAQVTGYIIAAIHILATSLSTILGRGINRTGSIHPLTVTFVSMGIGSVALLCIGLLIEQTPRLDWSDWAIVA